MTPEELERLAREAGFDKWTPTELVGKSAMDRIAVVGEYPCGELLARFAALVRAQALEDAANVAESWQDYRGVLSSVGPRIARAIKEQP